MNSMMKTLIVIILSFVVVLLVATIVQNLKPTHVFEITINEPYAEVWKWFSNPLTYEKIYPHWIKTVQRVDATTYYVNDQFGGSYDLKLISDKSSGVVDLMIGKEASRIRLIDLDGTRTVVIHFTKRWESNNFIAWFLHKLTTKRDFKKAKKVIEREGV